MRGVAVLEICAVADGLAVVDTKRHDLRLRIAGRRLRVHDFEGIFRIGRTIAGRFDSNDVITIADECVVFVDALLLVSLGIAWIAVSAAFGESAVGGNAIAGYSAFAVDCARIIGAIPRRKFSMLAKFDARFIGRTFGDEFAVLTFLFDGRLRRFLRAIDEAVFAVGTRFGARITRDFAFMTDDGVRSISRALSKAVGVATFFANRKLLHTAAAFTNLALGAKRLDELAVFTFLELTGIILVANVFRTFARRSVGFAGVVDTRLTFAAFDFADDAVRALVERAGVFAFVRRTFIAGVDGRLRFAGVVDARLTFAAFDFADDAVRAFVKRIGVLALIRRTFIAGLDGRIRFAGVIDTRMTFAAFDFADDAVRTFVKRFAILALVGSARILRRVVRIRIVAAEHRQCQCGGKTR